MNEITKIILGLPPKEQKFIRNIMWLKEAYGNNFEFEVFDDVKTANFTKRFQLWYRVLGHIDSSILEFVIFDYIKNSKWKPESPAHILEHYKNMYEKLLPEASDEFEIAISIWRSNRNIDKTIKTLKEQNKTVSAIAFSSIESHLHREATTDDINKWAKRDYIERYKIESKKNTDYVISNQNSVFSLENNNILKLGLGE